MSHLLENKLVVKLLALIAAVVLWLFVMQGENPLVEDSYTVPLTLVNLPPSTALSRDVNEVRVRVRARRTVFGGLSSHDVVAAVDLDGFETGTRTLRVQATAPQGVEVIGSKPETVEITAEPILLEQRGVNYVRIGALPTGMALGGLVPETSAVTLTGTRKALQAVVQVIGYVKLTPESPATSEVSVPLTAVGSNGRAVAGVQVAPEQVSVQVTLAPQTPPGAKN